MKESILVYYTVMQKFIAYAAVASFFFSVGVAVDGETGTLANFARAFCIIWSLLIFAALGLWVRHEGHAQAKQHEMQMALLQADIDSIAPPAPQAAPVAPLQVFTTAPTSGGSKTTVQQYEPEQIPPVDFIEWLFIRANGSGRVPSERAIFEEWTATANPWLATLEEQRIVEKVGTHDNAPRRIVEGVTVAMARERFGYSAPALPDSDGSQNARN